MTIDEDIAQLQEEFKQRQGEAAVLKVDLERAETTLHKANSSLAAAKRLGFMMFYVGFGMAFHVF